jgi:hypothetical protein
MHKFFIFFSVLTFFLDSRAADADLWFVFNQPKYAPGDTAYFSAYLVSTSPARNQQKIFSLQLVNSDLRIQQKKRILFKDGLAYGQFVLSDSIAPGVYMLELWDENFSNSRMQPLYTSSFVITNTVQYSVQRVAPTFKNIDPVNLSDLSPSYNPREKIEIGVTLNQTAASNSSTMSITVFKESLFDDAKSVLFFDRTEHQTVEPNPTNLLFNYSPFFKGRATFEKSGAGVPDSTRITFYINSMELVYTVYTQNDKLVFPLFTHFDDEEIFYSAPSMKDDEVVITLFENSPDHMLFIFKSMDKPDLYDAYKKKKNRIMTSFNYYASKENELTLEQNVMDFSDCDIEVDLTRYESFNTMADVLLNVIPMTRIKPSESGNGVRIFIESIASYAPQDPKFIIDGIMTDNTEYFLKLNPSRVKKIGVMRTRNALSRFGDLGQSGIILVETNIPNHHNAVQRTDKSLFITGISKPGIYHNQTHMMGVVNTTPDLRSALYWNPNVKVNSSESTNVSFYTSDDLGTYRIQIFGILEDGTPFISFRKFNVTLPKLKR